MPHPLRVPRVNNNDDVVTVVELKVGPGDIVEPGQLVGAVETDKSVLEVQAERGGHVLAVVAELGAQAAVGSVLLWLGDHPDEPVPEADAALVQAAAGAPGRPTAGARARLKALGLRAEQVPAAAARLTEADIDTWLVSQGAAAPGGAPAGSAPRTPAAAAERAPGAAGVFETLSPEEHGMLATVLWHRDHAVPGYIELEYDPQPWDAWAKGFADRHRLLMPPLMPLMAWRLVELAAQQPRLNAAIVGERRYRYTEVNLGFTVQAGATLYLAVVRDAARLDAAGFVDALGALQRRALAHRLGSAELTGATIAFTSMARWQVSRHVPILPPHTGLIVAHSAPRATGRAVLGATYDHRLLSGADVVQLLQALAQPPQPPQPTEGAAA
ncbi:MAG: 2-oxo acid dehydrogenase subunit E2 [Burkholderiales bacterium]|nr:2-oxo acid dehydrogenase subunit E2 [Burkholderiales bacterium]